MVARNLGQQWQRRRPDEDGRGRETFKQTADVKRETPRPKQQWRLVIAFSRTLTKIDARRCGSHVIAAHYGRLPGSSAGSYRRHIDNIQNESVGGHFPLSQRAAVNSVLVPCDVHVTPPSAHMAAIIIVGLT